MKERKGFLARRNSSLVEVGKKVSVLGVCGVAGSHNGRSLGQVCLL